MASLRLPRKATGAELHDIIVGAARSVYDGGVYDVYVTCSYQVKDGVASKMPAYILQYIVPDKSLINRFLAAIGSSKRIITSTPLNYISIDLDIEKEYNKLELKCSESVEKDSRFGRFVKDLCARLASPN
jgi:hypothetical protein